MWATSPTSMSSPRLVEKARCLQCTTNRPPLTDHKLSWSSEESAQYSPLAKRSSHWEEPTWRPRRLGWPGCHRYLELWSCLPVPIHIVSSVLTCAGMQELNWGRRLFKCSGVFGTVASPPKSWRKTWSCYTKTGTRTNQPERQAHPAPWSLPCTTCCFSPLGCSLHSPSPPRGKIMLEESPLADLL